MSKQKQPATLPGMAEATPTPHPTVIADPWRCLVCDELIAGGQKWTPMEGGRHRHSDCNMPSEAATPTPHPVPTEESPAAAQRARDLGLCVVCGGTIGTKQSFVQSIMVGRYEHTDCQDALDAILGTIPRFESATSEPTEHHPLAGGKRLDVVQGEGTETMPARLAEKQPTEPAKRGRKGKHGPRSPAREAVYIERLMMRHTLAQRRAIWQMLSSVCEPQLGEEPAK